MLLDREKEEVGRDCFEYKSVEGKQEFRVVIVSHWLRCRIFLLAELVAGLREVTTPSSWSSKEGFFVLGMQLKSSGRILGLPLIALRFCFHLLSFTHSKVTFSLSFLSVYLNL